MDAEFAADVDFESNPDVFDRVQVDFGVPLWCDLALEDPLHDVDDNEFFSKRALLLGTPLTKKPAVAMFQNKENEAPKIDLSIHPELSKLSLFKPRSTSRVSERARRISQQITIEDDKPAAPKISGALGRVPSSDSVNSQSARPRVPSVKRKPSLQPPFNRPSAGSATNVASARAGPVSGIVRKPPSEAAKPMSLSSRNVRKAPPVERVPAQTPTRRASTRAAASPLKQSAAIKPTQFGSLLRSYPATTQTTQTPKKMPAPFPLRRSASTSRDPAPIRPNIVRGATTPQNKENQTPKVQRARSMVQPVEENKRIVPKFPVLSNRTSLVERQTPQSRVVGRTPVDPVKNEPAKPSTIKPREFSNVLRSYKPYTGQTPKKSCTTTVPFGLRRSTSKCRDTHSVAPSSSSTSVNTPSTARSEKLMDMAARQEVIKKVVDRLATPRLPPVISRRHVNPAVSSFHSSKESH